MSGPLHTVLVVDDDPWFLAAVRTALAGESLRVLTTPDPMQALPLIEWEAVDVLVSDVSMPTVSGVDLMVRARQLFPHVSRVILTGRASLDVALKAINEAGVFRFLVKPLDPAALRETLRLAVQHSLQGRRELAAARAAAERGTALALLARAHPGIDALPEPGRPHAISAERLRALCAQPWPESLSALRGALEA